MQIPKIEVLSEDDIFLALKFGVEKQLFKDAHNLGQHSRQEVEKDETPILDPHSTSKSQTAVAGFIVGEDIRETENEDVIPDPSEPKKSQSTIRLPSLSLPHLGIAGWIVPTAIIGLILGLIGITLGVLFFLHKATLTILYEPDIISKEITIDDLTTHKLTQTFSETASIQTTGTKEVGEKAKGQVTIYNALESEQSIQSGAEFTTENGLTFVIDKALSVKPATQTVTSEGDILTTTSKTDITLTAGSIGPEGNIKKDTEFTIEGHSKKDIFAKAKSAFTGGTKDTIQAVSSTDYENINSSINKKLDKKAEDTAKSKGNDAVITELTSINTEEENYSHEVGDEADKLELNVNAKVTFFTFNEDDMKKLLIGKFSDAVGDNKKIEAENVSYEITHAEATKNEKKVTLDIKAKAKSSFQGNNIAITKAVNGKSIGDLKKILQGSYKAAGYEIVVDSPIPFLQNTMPFFAKNITVTYKAI